MSRVLCQFRNGLAACNATFAIKNSMQQINVPILGVTDGSEARAIRDGECSVLHNLTIDRGGTKVIAPPSVASSVNEKDYNEYYHTKAEQWLSVRNGGAYDAKGNKINTDGSVQSLSFMGNLVVMYCVDGTVRYAIYDGNYRYLGRLPELPKLNVGITPKYINTLTPGWYFKDDVAEDVDEKNIPLLWSNASKGFFDRCLAGLYQEGAFVDRTMFRLAARLFDGSYVAYSPIYYVEDDDALLDLSAPGTDWDNFDAKIGRDNKNFVAIPRSAAAKSHYYTAVRGFIPTLQLENYDLSRWRDVIISIDVFAVPGIMGHKSSAELMVGEAQQEINKVNSNYVSVMVNEVSRGAYERYVQREASEIKEEIANAALFYKIAEYDLKGNEVWRLKNTAPSQLAVQKRLPLNESPHELSSDVQRYLYNSKLHLAGVKERFCDAYVPHASKSGIGVVQVTSVVTMSVDGIEREFTSTAMAPSLVKVGDNYCIPPYVAYPDTRATKIKIYIGYNTETGTYKSRVAAKEFLLKAHNSLNLAYYLPDVELNEGGITTLKPIAITDLVGSGAVTYRESDGALTSFTVNNAPVDIVNTRRGVMRLSAVDNPLFFPAKSTYSFDADILAVYSNTVAVSQGQFGQHPLYVFTGNGVWLMGVDASGAGSYTTQVPCSREICNNGKGVTTTMQGVVFPTSMGLMLVNGAQAVNISADIAGLDTPELRKSGDAVERICGIVGKESIRNRVTFTEYLQNAFVAFDHNTNLLYVCNGEYDYVYVYNMTSGAWSTADGRYTELVKHTEKLMLRSVYHDGQGWQNIRYCFDNYDKEVDDVPVVMVMRGCLFGSTGFKRMGRCALRATLHTGRFGFYMLGSMDGVRWDILTGNQYVQSVKRAAPPTEEPSEPSEPSTSGKKTVRDFVCRSLSSRAYKFALFGFAGTVRSDAKFAMVECETESAFSGIR